MGLHVLAQSGLWRCVIKEEVQYIHTVIGTEQLSLSRVWCLSEVVQECRIPNDAVAIGSKDGWRAPLDSSLQCGGLDQWIRCPRENGENFLSLLGAKCFLHPSFVGICGVEDVSWY